MALVIKVTNDSITSDCKIIHIVDSTGTYNAVTNLTGYGSPNEERLNLYLRLFVTLKTSNGDESVDIGTYNPGLVASWDISINSDGYYEVYLFGTRDYNSSTTYAIGHVVYSVAQGKFYYSLTAGNIAHPVTDINFWKEATEVSIFKNAIALVQPNAYAGFLEYVELCNLRICKTRAFLNDDGCHKCSCGGTQYSKIRDLIDGAEIKGAIGAFAQAQVIVENATDECNCIEHNDE